MAYEGYLLYDGMEIVNNSRLTAYTEGLGLNWFQCRDTCPELFDALDRLGVDPKRYQLPDNPAAPWYDAVEPHSKDFAGVHVLEITNLDSSTYSAGVNELISDGGYASPHRYSSREMVFRCLLVGRTMLGVRHGFNWLASVLREGQACMRNKRYRHTYADFLPYTKGWWQVYKATGTSPRPDNVFQSPWYVGLATGEDAGSGNTYANLSLNGPEGATQDVLDILIPLEEPGEAKPSCQGFDMDFFIACPDPEDPGTSFRYLSDVVLTNGPIILSEHEVGKGCDAGGWQEVQFTLTALNPKVWRPKVNLGASPSFFSYADIPCTDEGPMGCGTGWKIYKDSDLSTDLDLFEAPLYNNRVHTYAGLIEVMWQRESTPVVPMGLPLAAASQMSASPGGVLTILDPACPVPPAFPTTPQEDFLCTNPADDPYIIRRYLTDMTRLPKFSPVAFTLDIVNLNTTDVRDVYVRIVPNTGSVEVGGAIEFIVTYLPARATVRVDGVHRSADILTSPTEGSDDVQWLPADHLVVSSASGASYSYPEALCTRDMNVGLRVPEQYNIDLMSLSIYANVRDG